MKRKICLLALAILFCVPVLAHAVLNSYTFDVYDEDGTALTSGIVVQVQAASGSTAETIYSDPNGKVSLSNPITVTGQVKFFYGANTCDVVVYDNPLTTKIKKAGITPRDHRIVFPKTQFTSQQMATVTFSATTATIGTLGITGGSTLFNTSFSDSSITNVGDIALDTISADNATSFSMGSNWTNAGRTVADAGILTTVDINGGSIDGAVIGVNSAAAGTFAAIKGTSISIGAGGSEVEITSTPAVLNRVANFPGVQATAAVDFNATGTAAMNITIGGVIYLEADTADSSLGVWTNGASAAESAASLIEAINGDTRAAVPFTAYADATGDGVILIWDAVGSAGNVTITSSDGSATTANSVGGENAGTKQVVNITRTITTNDLLAGVITIPMPFVPTGFNINAVDAAGTGIAFTDKVTIAATPNRILITTDGGTNLANTNVVHLTVWE